MKKGKFLVGALVGGALGVLFAPKKGSQTRKELAGKMEELFAKAKEIDKDELKEKIEKKIKEIEKSINDLDKETVMAVAKDKSEKIKNKTAELYELAKKSGQPVLEDAVKSVKASLADVTKEILKKLEK